MHILLWDAQPHTSMQVLEMIYWHEKLSRIHFFTPILDSCCLPKEASRQHILYINWASVVMGIMIITLLINQPSYSSDSKCACSSNALLAGTHRDRGRPLRFAGEKRWVKIEGLLGLLELNHEAGLSVIYPVKSSMWSLSAVLWPPKPPISPLIRLEKRRVKPAEE